MPTHKERSSTQQVFVVEGLTNNFLGLPANTALNQAARVDMTSDSDPIAGTFREPFPDVFEGLGNLGEE